jgi:hypothetical protein
MLGKNIIFICLLFSAASYAQTGINSSGNSASSTYTGILQKDCDEIDGVLDEERANEDRKLENATEVILDHSDAKEKSCFADLDLGQMFKLGLPSLSSFAFKGLLDRMKKAACEAATKAINRAANNMAISYKSPYGLVSLKAGVSTKGDQVGVNKTAVDPYSVLDKEAISLGTEFGKKAAGDVLEHAPKVDGVNRKIRNESSNENDDVSDWRKGAYDSLKKL